MAYRDLEKKKAYQKRYAIEHREQIYKSRRKCWETNGEVYREQMRKHRLRFLYKMSDEDYNHMLKEQNFCCKICGKPPNPDYKGHHTKLFIEHDHSSGKVRGLVCGGCNLLIAAFESPLADKIRQYLEENKTVS